MFCLSRSRLVIIGKDIIHYPFGPLFSGYRTSHRVLFCWMENIRILLQVALALYCVVCWLGFRNHFSLHFFLSALAFLLVMHVLQIWLTASKPTGLSHVMLLQDFQEATKFNVSVGWGVALQRVPISIFICLAVICIAPLLFSLFCLLATICPSMAFHWPDHTIHLIIFGAGTWVLCLVLIPGPVELWEYR